MRVDFHLYGIIAGKDKDEFEKTLKAVHQRFREQVFVTVRSAESSDLADAGLGLIKRQILEKTNALLGKPLIRAAIISDFSYMEQ
jgi:flagellar FliL protein